MKITALIISAMFMLISCDSDTSKSVPEQVEPLEGVFVLGSVDGNVGYWHDGEWNQCEVPVGADSCSGDSIYITEYDVYIGGGYRYAYNQYNFVHVPGYWKNLEWEPLYTAEPIASAGVFSVTSSDEDIYFAGHLNHEACYWKNNDLIYLDDFDNSSVLYKLDPYMEITCIMSNNNNIYGAVQSTKPVYFKNKNLISLSIDGVGSLETVIMHNGDIYAAGRCHDVEGNYFTGYWKNDEWVALPNPNSDGRIIIITGIAVSGDDVYVCAYSQVYVESAHSITILNYSSGYWKNGKWFDLESSYGTPKAEAMVEHNGDIYIVGGCYSNYNYSYTSHPSFYAGYWKNGDWNELGVEGEDALAFDIVVK